MSRYFPCPVCKAKKGQPCHNTIRPGEPLPGRPEHLARALPPDRKTPRIGRKEL